MNTFLPQCNLYGCVFGRVGVVRRSTDHTAGAGPEDDARDPRANRTAARTSMTHQYCKHTHAYLHADAEFKCVQMSFFHPMTCI